MAEETITRDELAEALDSGEFGLNSSFVGGRELAVSVFAYIAAHREPEYEPGAMYQDADGANWEYQPPPLGHPKCCWRRPGSEAAWSTGTPRRPLRRLVPETDRSGLVAKLDRITGICRNPAAAVGEVMGAGRRVPGDRLADTILAVIRGEETGRD